MDKQTTVIMDKQKESHSRFSRVSRQLDTDKQKTVFTDKQTTVFTDKQKTIFCTLDTRQILRDNTQTNKDARLRAQIQAKIFTKIFRESKILLSTQLLFTNIF